MRGQYKNNKNIRVTAMNKLIFLYVTVNVSDLNMIFMKSFKASFD